MPTQRPTSSPWPLGLSNPAIRALEQAGYQNTEQLTAVTEKTLLGLHGMGAKGIRILRAALTERGLSFAQEKKPTA
jgi:DNA-directed RNA polymerase alpha subunit